MFEFVIFNINSYLTILLICVSVYGDYLVFHAQLQSFQALFDNATHGLIGGLSWLVVCIKTKNRSNTHSLFEVGLCTLLASIIDVDHFVAAKSLQLKDAVSLPRRPPLHCSTWPFGFCTLALLVAYFFQSSAWKKASLMVFTAVLSHHTRDATRRGYWVYPFGSTPPIPYFSYIIITCLVPHFVSYINEIVRIDTITYRNLNDAVI